MSDRAGPHGTLDGLMDIGIGKSERERSREAAVVVDFTPQESARPEPYDRRLQRPTRPETAGVIVGHRPLLRQGRTVHRYTGRLRGVLPQGSSSGYHHILAWGQAIVGMPLVRPTEPVTRIFARAGISPRWACRAHHPPPPRACTPLFVPALIQY